MSEFHIDLGRAADGAEVDNAAMQRIEDEVLDIDPAAVIDFTASTGRLRVAAALEREHLASVLGAAGHRVALDAIVQLPSICCGGCSG